MKRGCVFLKKGPPARFRCVRFTGKQDARMRRVVEPEILDCLPHDDPEARRSRRDLRMINAVMGNTSWLRRQVQKRPLKRIVEIGAGDGGLCAQLAKDRPELELAAVDLAPRPVDLPGRIEWMQGDLFDALPELSGDALLANLFLHHFETASLRRLGGLIQGFRFICVSEPLRARRAHWLGGLLHPLVNRVTRHDMHISIRAGFRRGEMPALLGLEGGDWEVKEFSTWRGAQRVVACRR